jgi:hypothetical protein
LIDAVTRHGTVLPARLPATQAVRRAAVSAAARALAVAAMKKATAREPDQTE